MSRLVVEPLHKLLIGLIRVKGIENVGLGTEEAIDLVGVVAVSWGSVVAHLFLWQKS